MSEILSLSFVSLVIFFWVALTAAILEFIKTMDVEIIKKLRLIMPVAVIILLVVQILYVPTEWLNVAMLILLYLAIVMTISAFIHRLSWLEVIGVIIVILCLGCTLLIEVLFLLFSFGRMD